MNDILNKKLDEYLNNIDLIKNSTQFTERERRIYFAYNIKSFEIYCIAFDERMIQLLTHSLDESNSFDINYDYKQY